MSSSALQALCVVGVVLALGMVVIGLPGTVLIVIIAALYGYATDFKEVSGYLILYLLLLSAAAETADNVIGAVWARRWGSSFRGIVGSILGAIAGAALGSAVMPVVGTIIGGLLGSFAGAFLLEYSKKRDGRTAARAGWGAFAGRVIGVALKLVVGLLMSALLLWRVF